MSYSITSYQPQYKDQIANLVLSIQQVEFHLPITLADQPDLLDIQNFYQQGNGNFWCALDDDHRVIGTIALIDIGYQSGAIRKMFVHADHRGGETKVAQQLLHTLELWAKEQHTEQLYLGTIDCLHAEIGRAHV